MKIYIKFLSKKEMLKKYADWIQVDPGRAWHVDFDKYVKERFREVWSEIYIDINYFKKMEYAIDFEAEIVGALASGEISDPTAAGLRNGCRKYLEEADNLSTGWDLKAGIGVCTEDDNDSNKD